jgi:FkbM family methyltransferase
MGMAASDSSLIYRIRRKIGSICGRELRLRPDCTISKERMGSAYGGWDIAVGPLGRKSVVYSFGIGEDASFDLELIKRYGLIVHGFDPTPRSMQWISKQPVPSSFVFHGYGLAHFDGMLAFNPPENDEHVSYTVLDRPATETHAVRLPVKKLSTIMKELGHTKVDVLKMDIEGAEYGVLEDIRVSGTRPYQLLIEFHHHFPNVSIARTREAINSIKHMGYGLFSVSGSGMEYGFIYQTDNRL